MKIAMLSLSMVLALCPSLWAAADADGDAPPTLFEAVEAQAEGLPVEPYVLEDRSVRVRQDELASSVTGAELVLNLLPQTEFKGVIERVTRRSETSYTVAGRLESDPLGSFIMVVEEDVVVGLVEAPTLGRLFKLGYVGDGVHRIAQIDNSRFPKCETQAARRAGGPRVGGAVPLPEEGSSSPLAGAENGSEAGSCSAPQPVFDVLILYTTKARQAAGGSTAIRAECQLAIDTANQGYANSQINARMRLVYRGETTYGESGDFGDHLDRITDDDDGSMDGVHGLRNTYRADFVSLWVNDDDGGEICGRAHCDSDADDAFSVVNWGCAVSNFSFHHEIGHNQGSAHNDDDCSWPCYCARESYSYGWRFFNLSRQGRRTVMAYDNDAGAYMRINWFSNPDVTVQGRPTGVVDEADNARSIREVRRYYEGLRLSRLDVWVDFNFLGIPLGTFFNPYTTVASGASAIASGVGASEKPTLWIKAGSTSETVTIGKEMVVQACGGSVIIGQ